MLLLVNDYFIDYAAIVNLSHPFSQFHSNVASSTGLHLDPWFVTGVADAEGSFPLFVSHSETKIGWRVKLGFSIGAGHRSANRV
jgi:hypothetical protein